MLVVICNCVFVDVSFEEVVSMLMVFMMVFYCFKIVGCLVKGECIFIYVVIGGVGLVVI